MQRFHFVLIAAAIWHSSAAWVQSSELRCEYLVDPIGVEPRTPKLQWALAGSKDVAQVSFRVLVHEEHGGPTVFDSGLTHSSAQEVLVHAQLQGATGYFWTVEVWEATSNSSSGPSDPGHFVTGVWDQWGDAAPIWDPSGSDGFVQMRRETTLPSNVKSAYVFVTALPHIGGLHSTAAGEKLLAGYSLAIDGVLVGKGPGRSGTCGPLCPTVPSGGEPFCNCSQHHVYDGYDVTSLVVGKERIVLAIDAFNPDGGKVQALLRVRTASSTFNVVTDAHWKAAGADSYRKPTCCASEEADQPHENIDARSERVGWRSLGYMDEAWVSAKIQDSFTAGLRARPAAALEFMVVNPVRVQDLGGNRWFIDMGQEIMGGLQVTFENATSGQILDVRLGEEMVAASGSQPPRVRPMRTGNDYHDVWTLRDGIQVFEHHEYFEWRYAEIWSQSGSSSSVKALTVSVAAWVVRYKADYSQSKIVLPASNSISDVSAPNTTLLSSIWDLSKYTMVATTIDAYTDSNTRQRDVVCMESIRINALTHYAVAAEVAVQRYTLEYSFNNPLPQLSLPNGVWPAEWYPISVLAVHDYTLQSGDTSLALDYFDALRRFTMTPFLAGNGLVDCTVHQPNAQCRTVELDWPNSLRDGYHFCKSSRCVGDVQMVLNAYALAALEAFTDLARWLGRDEDEQEARDAATALRPAMQQRFFTGSGQCLGETSFCGEVVGPDYAPVTLRCCDASETIESVEFGDWGTPSGSCGAYTSNESCTGGTEDVAAWVLQQCKGRSSCTLRPYPALGDPCNKVAKRFVVQARCTGTGGGMGDASEGTGPWRDGLSQETNHTSWHSSVFALAFGAAEDVDGTIASETFNYLVRRTLDESPDVGIVGGMQMSQYILEALYRFDSDHGKAALRVLLNKGKNGWANMLEQGATTTMEAWTTDEKPNLSWSHPWGASPGNIIVRFLFGIRPVEPGFSRIHVKPQPGTLASGRLSLPTLRGTIHESFYQEQGSFRVELELPVGIIARVYLPREPCTQTDGSYVVTIDGNDSIAQLKGDYVYVESIGAGQTVLACISAPSTPSAAYV